MKKIQSKTGVLLIKYVAIMACIMFSVMALIFSPDLYKLSDLNFGPCIALLGTGIATLIWNSVDD